MIRILVVDNYDSFAYNLVQYVGELAEEVSVRGGNRDTAEVSARGGNGDAAEVGARGSTTNSAEVSARGGNRDTAEVVVRRNDRIDVPGVRDLDPDGIVVSPGPGTPAEAGVSIPVFRDLSYPTLGVCLGHQALCAANGAPVVRAPEVVHGKPSTVTHDGTGVFAGLPDRVEVGRYHSLCVEHDGVPDALVETARTADDERGVVMGVRHRERPHVGIQFHPESILTDDGKRMVRNFIRLCEDRNAMANEGDTEGTNGDR